MAAILYYQFKLFLGEQIIKNEITNYQLLELLSQQYLHTNSSSTLSPFSTLFSEYNFLIIKKINILDCTLIKIMKMKILKKKKEIGLIQYLLIMVF